MIPNEVQTTKMTFDDEFNNFSSSTDGSNGWMTQLPYGGAAAYTLADNDEAEFYSNSSIGYNPFSLNNGVLSITAQPGSNSLGLPYNSGAITSFKSFAQTYGYFEVDAKLPAGQGLWPAFWLLPASGVYSSELDVFEQLGSAPSTIFSTVHGDTNGSWGVVSQAVQTVDTSAAFHTYGVDWEPDTTTFYIDGKVTASASTPASMNVPDFLLLNLAVGGNSSWPGSPNGSTSFPASLQIDYVRAYATANTRDISGSAASSDNQSQPTAAASAAQVTPVVTSQSTTTSLGSGPDTIKVALSEDAWQGDAQALISVDGTAIGGVQTLSASHTAGDSNVFNVLGNWGSGAHSVAIHFLNDAYGGTPQTDRNLYVDTVSQNGTASSVAPAAMMSAGTLTYPTGTAADTSGLVLHMAEDAYKGDAQFSVAVDGTQQGGVQTVTTVNGLGILQDFAVASGLSAGQHDVSVSFLNDAYSGTTQTDRNLYVGGASYNGTAASNAQLSFFSAGTQDFHLTVPS